MYERVDMVSDIDSAKQKPTVARRPAAPGSAFNHRITLLGFIAFLLAHPAAAEKNYGPGVTDTEIKIGQNMLRISRHRDR